MLVYQLGHLYYLLECLIFFLILCDYLNEICEQRMSILSNRALTIDRVLVITNAVH